MSRLDEFALPEHLIPAKLRALLEPVTHERPHQKVEIAASYERDHHGPARESLHMLMIAVPSRKASQLGVLREGGAGVVSSPIGLTDNKGALRRFAPSVSGYDPIVMAWGSGNFFAYNLADKVWMSLGLSPRCIGNQHQRLVYDDPAAPEFAVAEGEISSSYNFQPSRDVLWTMRNDYLRRYLWMRGATGVRVLFYEALLEDTAEVRAIMQGQAHFLDEVEGNWYILDLREWDGSILLQVWATVPAVTAKLCVAQDVHRLVWPGDDEPMTKKQLGAASARLHHLYLRDSFLERYEQNTIYDTVPVRTPDGIWLCGPSYSGQWSFAGCRRMKRNLVCVDAYELYKNVPDREILHAFAHAVTAEEAEAAANDEHIVAKVQGLLEALLDLGDLSALGDAVGVHREAADLVGFDRREVVANGWLHYPRLCGLAQVAPLDMTQQAFLARCKTLHELLQKLPNAYLRALLRTAGCAVGELERLGSCVLTQALSNILDELNANADGAGAFPDAALPINWRARSGTVAALFVTNELRQADAHEARGDWLRSLEDIGFDVALLNDGYGAALDFMLDSVIGVLRSLNQGLAWVLRR